MCGLLCLGNTCSTITLICILKSIDAIKKIENPLLKRQTDHFDNEDISRQLFKKKRKNRLTWSLK